MSFKTYLNETLHVTISSYWSDGVVTALVNGSKFKYYIDTAFHPEIKRLEKSPRKKSLLDTLEYRATKIERID